MRHRKIGRFRCRRSCATQVKVLADFSVTRYPAARWHLSLKLGTAHLGLLSMQATIKKAVEEVLGWRRCLSSCACLPINAGHAVPSKCGVQRLVAYRTIAFSM